MRRAFSFIIGVIVGGSVGGIVALLFAPSSGKDIRSQINSRAKSFVSDIRQASATKRIELQERLESLRSPQK